MGVASWLRHRHINLHHCHRRYDCLLCGWWGHRAAVERGTRLGRSSGSLGRPASKSSRTGEVLLGTSCAWYPLVASGLRVGAVLTRNGGPPCYGWDAPRKRLHRISSFMVGCMVALEQISVIRQHVRDWTIEPGAGIRYPTHLRAKDNWQELHL